MQEKQTRKGPEREGRDGLEGKDDAKVLYINKWSELIVGQGMM